MACFCVNGTHDILLLIGKDKPYFSIHTDLIFHTYMADDGAETPKVLPNLIERHFKHRFFTPMDSKHAKSIVPIIDSVIHSTMHSKYPIMPLIC